MVCCVKTAGRKRLSGEIGVIGSLGRVIELTCNVCRGDPAIWSRVRRIDSIDESQQGVDGILLSLCYI